MKRNVLFCIISICLSSFSLSFAQIDKPVLRVLTDTVKLGTPVRFALTYTHDQFEEVVFPDSNYSYQPFEWVRKQFATTKTNGKRSLDSAVYELRTFSMDTLQAISIPVFIIDENGDTTFLRSNEAEIKLTFKVQAEQLSKVLQAGVSESLKSNTLYAKIKNLPQSILYFLVVLLILLLVGAVFLLFNKRILKAYQMRRLRRQYERFRADFESTTRKENSSKNTETALLLWKTFLEGMEGKPYTSYTTKETLTALSDTSLVEPLKNLDKAIYGGMISDSTQSALDFLKNYAEGMYDTKMKEVLNA
ncbi:MAG: hypothetical protein EAZ57_07705 [Cytophagales bacterium]|nr:MAG: hypothetical protein EAZ67_08790 [Cytophagales bacterium]TAF60422.1 MAG: hypothetical protein EAZ57_07705 [Cytophagales bacterium]